MNPYWRLAGPSLLQIHDVDDLDLHAASPPVPQVLGHQPAMALLRRWFSAHRDVPVPTPYRVCAIRYAKMLESLRNGPAEGRRIPRSRPPANAAASREARRLACGWPCRSFATPLGFTMVRVVNAARPGGWRISPDDRALQQVRYSSMAGASGIAPAGRRVWLRASRSIE